LCCAKTIRVILVHTELCFIRYSLIGVCDINGFIPQACQVVKTSGTGEDVGNINLARFEQWVEAKLVPILGDYSIREPRSLVVFDNATIHHSDRIVNLIEETGARIVYLPPYSPDLNPIEIMFASYKLRLQKLGKNFDWLDAHYTALVESVTPSMAMNIFSHCKVGHISSIRTEDNYDEDIMLLILLLIQK